MSLSRKFRRRAQLTVPAVNVFRQFGPFTYFRQGVEETLALSCFIPFTQRRCSLNLNFVRVRAVVVAVKR